MKDLTNIKDQDPDLGDEYDNLKKPSGEEKSKEEIYEDCFGASSVHQLQQHKTLTLDAMQAYADQEVKKAIQSTVSRALIIEHENDQLKQQLEQKGKGWPSEEELDKAPGGLSNYRKLYLEAQNELNTAYNEYKDLLDKYKSIHPSGGGWSDYSMIDSYNAGFKNALHDEMGIEATDWLSSYKKNLNK